MSAAAHRGDHDIAFYEAAIENTFTLNAIVGALTEAPTDLDGPLPPGRYLIQLVGASDAAVIAWVHVGKFVAGTPLAPANPVAAGTKRIPLSPSSIIAIETHALQGYSDRIAVQSVGGTVTVHITRVSNEARKSDIRR